MSDSTRQGIIAIVIAAIGVIALLSFLNWLALLVMRLIIGSQRFLAGIGGYLRFYY